MLHKRSAALILAVTLPALAGCVQATRHSNTMVFGTNTTVGLKVGQNVNQIPEVLIAYDRQEAVIMPLLANTSEKAGEGNLLSPCSLEEETEWAFGGDGNPIAAETTYAVGEGDIIHPCKFVGVRKDDDNFLIQDSYSVLASFGARIEGDASNVKGTVGIAQYFATGVAAQNLAITGGAAIVSVGEAAEKAVANPENSANAAAASTGAEPIAPRSGKKFDTAWGELITNVSNENDPNNRLALVRAAITRAQIPPGPAQRIEQGCTGTKEDCLAQLGASVAIFNNRPFYAEN